MRKTSVAVMVIFLFESVTPKVLDHSCGLSFFSTITRYLDHDTLQFKILWTWINISVEPATRHLTYYCMFLFLSNKPSF